MQPVVAPAQPRKRQQELRDRRHEDGNCVDVEPRRVRARARHAERKAEDDDHVPQHRAQRGHGEVVVAVEDSDHDPGQPEDEHERKEDAREHGRDRPEVVRAVAEDLHHPRRDEHEESRQAPEPEQHQPEERRSNSPGARPLTLHEQVAEDGDERGRQCGVGHE